MDKKKKVVITSSLVGAVVVALVVTFGALAISGVLRGFDAQKYVKAVLDYNIKGDVTAALEVMDGTTEEGLQEQCDAEVVSFVENTVLDGMEVDEELKGKYVSLCKEVFASMKYEVHEAEKISGKEYQVTVTYQPTNMFTKYQEARAAEYQRFSEKVENGEYRGKTEEIQSQMLQEFLVSDYAIFEETYKNIEYGEEKTMTFTVKKGENDLYGVDGEQIIEFFTEIMSLDAIQD